MLRSFVVLVVVVLMTLLSACAGARGGAAAPGDAYTLRVDLAIAGELDNDRGRGAVRADLTGELTFVPDDAGTQVRSRVVAVRDVFVDPRLGRHADRPDARTLRAVLLATDDYWPLTAAPTSAPTPAASQPAVVFFHGMFTRDLAPPAWLPSELPAEGWSVTTTRLGLHGGVEAEIEETRALVRVDRSGAAPVAEFSHTTAIRSVDGSAGPGLEIHERGVLRVDLATGLPVRHTRERAELVLRDGSRVARNSMTIDARFTAVAGR